MRTDTTQSRAVPLIEQRPARRAAWVLLVLLVTTAHVLLPARLAELMPRVDAVNARSSPMELVNARHVHADTPRTTPAAQASKEAAVTRPRARHLRNRVASTGVAAQDPQRLELPTGAVVQDLTVATPGEAQAAGWPTAGRLQYALSGSYESDEVSGSALLEWARTDDHYTANLAVTASRGFSVLFARHLMSQGSVTLAGLSSERYDDEMHIGFEPSAFLSHRVEPEAVVLDDERALACWAGTQDPLSMLLQLGHVLAHRPQLLAAPHTVELALALPGATSRLAFDVQAPEALNLPFGSMQAVRLASRPMGSAGSDLTIEAWFVREMPYAPARIRIRHNSRTDVDLSLSHRPESVMPQQSPA